MKRLVLDIETTLDHQTIRLVGLKEYGVSPQEGYFITNPSILEDYLNSFDEEVCLLTFNGTGFDLPVLERVWGFKWEGMHTDLYLLGKIIDPDRESHSLASWAKEIGLGLEKTEVDYDKAPLEELKDYLLNDLELTEEVAKYMQTKPGYKVSGSLRKILDVEQEVKRSVVEQGYKGFPFDLTKACNLVAQMDEHLDALESTAKDFLPFVDLPKSKLDYPPKIQVKKDGTPSAAMLKWCERNGIEFNIKEVPYTEPLKTTYQISLKNQTDLKKWLLSQGWKPTMYNTKPDKSRGSPMLYDRISKEVCPNVLDILSVSQVSVIQDYLITKSRRNVLLSDKDTGWIKKASSISPVIPPQGFVINHDADTLGTPTGRYKHRVIANVPRVTSPYGKEMRELFIPSPHKVMVGWDASALEAMMEAHYVMPYDKDYAEALTDEDVHTRNQRLVGLPTRDMAKTFKYAITYGASPCKLASILNVPEHTAKLWYDEFWEVNVGLKELKARLKAEWERRDKQFIPGLDGRLIQTRSEHSLLNSLFQSAGAIVMKYATVLAETRAKQEGLDARPLIRYHDEEQWECSLSDAEKLGKIGVWSIEAAAKYLKLRVPVTGEFKIGNNWAETH